VDVSKPVKVIFLDSFYPSERGEDWYEKMRDDMERVLKKELEES